MLRILSENDFSELLIIEALSHIAPWDRGTFERCWQAGYQGWVIEYNNKIIGFIIITLYAGESHILNIAIHPDFRSQGFGQQLLEHALAIAKSKGANIAFLEVRKSNDSAISLYQKLGFVQIGERKAYYPDKSGREDALVFAKDLGVK